MVLCKEFPNNIKAAEEKGILQYKAWPKYVKNYKQLLCRVELANKTTLVDNPWKSPVRLIEGSKSEYSFDDVLYVLAIINRKFNIRVSVLEACGILSGLAYTTDLTDEQKADNAINIEAMESFFILVSVLALLLVEELTSGNDEHKYWKALSEVFKFWRRSVSFLECGDLEQCYSSLFANADIFYPIPKEYINSLLDAEFPAAKTTVMTAYSKMSKTEKYIRTKCDGKIVSDIESLSSPQGTKNLKAMYKYIKSIIPMYICQGVLCLVDRETQESLSGLEYDQLVPKFDCVERTIDWITNLWCTLHTRVIAYYPLRHLQVGPRIKSSAFFTHPENQLIKDLYARLIHYDDFEVDLSTGHRLSYRDYIGRYYKKLGELQLHFHDMVADKDEEEEEDDDDDIEPVSEIFRRLSLLPLRDFADEHSLTKLLTPLPEEHLLNLINRLCITDSTLIQTIVKSKNLSNKGDGATMKLDPNSVRGFLVTCILYHFSNRKDTMKTIEEMPAYPTEDSMFNQALTPGAKYDGSTSLALPRLDLQFLTIFDYLHRNFQLIKTEAADTLRDKITGVLHSLNVQVDPSGESSNAIKFLGNHEDAVPIKAVSVLQVTAPMVGGFIPAKVRGELVVGIGGLDHKARNEWDQIAPYDQILLLYVQPPRIPRTKSLREALDDIESIPDSYGLVSIRGVEVVSVLDEEGKEVRGRNEQKLNGADWVAPVGTLRTFRVQFDPAQYALDSKSSDSNAGLDKGISDEIYSMFNIAIRIPPKEGNFKAILQSIKSMLAEGSEMTIPSWLEATLLGYGDSKAAHYSSLEHSTDPNMRPSSIINFRDSFINLQHIKDVYFDKKIHINGEVPNAPFIHWEVDLSTKNEVVVTPSVPKTILVKGCPVELNIHKRNMIPFTSLQVEAIRSGVNPGLTVIVGPPGTGKTDTAVQIVSLLLQNRPNERLLIIAASNQALNDLFAKLIKLDVDERHVLRLGIGEKQLREMLGFSDTSGKGMHDFSKWGRINHGLKHRIELLSYVGSLASSMECVRKYDESCMDALTFYKIKLKPALDQLMIDLNNGKKLNDIEKTAGVKVTKFIYEDEDIEKVLDLNNNYLNDMIELMDLLFKEIDAVHPLEVLHTVNDRSNWLLTHSARVVAMTCTHASIQRDYLHRIGFEYDSIVLEEASLVLEMENFVPLVLQTRYTSSIETSSAQKSNSIKRMILIGDHCQLPPVVRSRALQVNCNMDQSMFLRFIRLGFPYVQLHKQGRCRPQIADLFRWRYRNPPLLDMDHTTKGAYAYENPGFGHVTQFINLEDYQGRGEYAPVPHMYQNLGEAEFVVGMYMYMRLRGYPSSSIVILTTYNGQKRMIQEIINKRCCYNSATQLLFGMPHRVTTVDQFQGQDADYVLISMVRTENIGYLRDIRRSIVACSRAKLGLYIVGRYKLVSSCIDLKPAYDQFKAYPLELSIVDGETYGDIEERRTLNQPPPPGSVTKIKDVDGIWKLVKLEAQKQLK